MTPAEIAAAVGFFLMVSGALWGIWWKIIGEVKDAKTQSDNKASAAIAKADFALLELNAHKLHVAETFATKAGMQEQTVQLMRAIEGVANRLDSVHERLDRVLDRPARTRS
ncbi:hypothetical protein [Limoniibacter endophyticus]|uniref:Uncharacterized protein n=1 Tax=Limoniibacter endophyticus TaxID=1565040 RepID=A0A8J3DES7_9HYPH|nr:hypothetical protein [Limoniibacter endophyticus]GHC61719.1 hypothetical protein GCM10010136_02440 [Limoniibacter endophyticus]